MDVNIFSTLVEDKERRYASDTYIKFGDSDEIIGSVILSNPKELKIISETNDSIQDNDLIRQIEATILEFYRGKASGVVKIYYLCNVITEKNEKLEKVLKEKLNPSLNYTDFDKYKKEYKNFNFTILAWGEENFDSLLLLKNKWYKFMRKNHVQYIGIEGRKEMDYDNLSTDDMMKKVDLIHDLKDQYEALLNKDELNSMIYFKLKNTKKDRKTTRKDNIIETPNKAISYSYDGPKMILDGFSKLKKKEDYKLISYIIKTFLGGNGYISAFKEEIEVPIPDESEKNSYDYPKYMNPEKAEKDFMLAIDGDRSALSYLQAAILYHELKEYGASWHGIDWGAETIIEEGHKLAKENRWAMEENRPKTLSPYFYINKNGNPVVVLYTVNTVGMISLNEYTHTFDKESYSLISEKKLIARSGLGERL